jgi:hypothetical protein
MCLREASQRTVRIVVRVVAFDDDKRTVLSYGVDMLRAFVPENPMNRFAVSRKISIAMFAAATLLTACATPPPVVHADYDHGANFAAYHTFGFPPNTGTDRGGYETLATSRLKEAATREMSARGYTYNENSPDLLVNFYSEVRDKTEVYSSPGWFVGSVGWHHGLPRYGYYGFGAGPFYDPYVDVVQYKSRKLKLDVVDAARKKVVWEANVEDRLSEEAQDNPQPLIEQLVTAMFRKFPRGASQ